MTKHPQAHPQPRMFGLSTIPPDSVKREQMIFVGTDPGKAGYTSWIDQDMQVVACEEQALIGTGKGNTFDVPAMARLARRITGGPGAPSACKLWVIERQWSMGRSKGGHQTSFNKGLCYGLWLGLITANGARYEEVSPQAWRKAHGVQAVKSKKLADEKLDNARLLRQRKEGLSKAISKAQALFPAVDMRKNARCRTPSPDKAISLLLAAHARNLFLQLQAV